MTKLEFTINNVKEGLRQKVKDFDRYRFTVTQSQGIVTVEAGVYGEASVDARGKDLKEILDELAPRVAKIIESYKGKPPGQAKGQPITELGSRAIESKREFRRGVLQVHYDISGGSSWNLVMRSDAAKELGLENYNEKKLLDAIKYLEDKGYLRCVTNAQDQITDLGIDEVENNSPNLSLKKEITSQQRVGILNKGKNNIFAYNLFGGVGVGIRNEGKSTLAFGNEFDVDRKSKEKWYQMWWGEILIGLLVTIIGGLILGLIL